MPVGTLHQPPLVRLSTAVAAAPPRLRPKGPVGPDFYRLSPAAKARPKQSAVERLEADKAKYVKSQVALAKQQPVRPPEVRKPLLMTPSATLRPTRRTPARPISQHSGGVPLDLVHLSNLITGMNDGPVSTTTTTVSSEESQPKSSGDCTTAATSSSAGQDSTSAGADRVAERLRPPPCLDWSSPAKVRLKQAPGCAASPAAATIRRVDVIPQTRPVRAPCRPPQQYMRQPLQPMPLRSQVPLRLAASNPRLFYSRTTPGPSPLKPVPALPHNHSPSSPVDASALVHAPPNVHLLLPPASPAITRLSSSSSRKRPSLTRSKSDMSDRFSRGGTELERFFNLCGLDASDLQDLTGPGSDRVSIARLRSASAPGSECAGSGGEGGEEEGGGGVGGEGAERVPYGVSVIERNARVIKWLYGIRHAKDNVKSTNL